MPGLGVYHSGVQVFGTEYTFAGNGTVSTGVFSHRPRIPPAAGDGSRWVFKETVNLGPCLYPKTDVKEMVAFLSGQFKANSYHLTSRNCNHFSEAFCAQLGVSFPSWINRLANVGDKFKSLMPAPKEGSTLAVVEGIHKTPDTVDLFTRRDVNIANMACLNEAAARPFKSICSSNDLPHVPSARVFVESDGDEQLLMLIPFTKCVKLMAIILTVPGDAKGKCPKEIRLWKNRPHMDFADIDNADATETLLIREEDLKEPLSKGMRSILLPLTFVKFQDVSFLSICIVSNFGAQTSAIHALQLLGQDPKGMDLSQLKKTG